jgi:hypothetical protein
MDAESAVATPQGNFCVRQYVEGEIGPANRGKWQGRGKGKRGERKREGKGKLKRNKGFKGSTLVDHMKANKYNRNRRKIMFMGVGFQRRKKWKNLNRCQKHSSGRIVTYFCSQYSIAYSKYNRKFFF